MTRRMTRHEGFVPCRGSFSAGCQSKQARLTLLQPDLALAHLALHITAAAHTMGWLGLLKIVTLRPTVMVHAQPGPARQDPEEVEVGLHVGGQHPHYTATLVKAISHYSISTTLSPPPPLRPRASFATRHHAATVRSDRVAPRGFGCNV